MPDKLKHSTRGANPSHGTGSAPLDELGETQLRRSGDLKTTIPYRRVGMRRSEEEGSPNEVSPEGVSRGRAAQVSPNSAFGASRLRSKKSVLPAAPFRRFDREIHPTRSIHFVLPTFSLRATDFLTIPTDFFFSAYGVIRTNHTAPDPPDFRIFAAPRPLRPRRGEGLILV